MWTKVYIYTEKLISLHPPPFFPLIYTRLIEKKRKTKTKQANKKTHKQNQNQDPHKQTKPTKQKKTRFSCSFLSIPRLKETAI